MATDKMHQRGGQPCACVRRALSNALCGRVLATRPPLHVLKESAECRAEPGGGLSGEEVTGAGTVLCAGDTLPSYAPLLRANNDKSAESDGHSNSGCLPLWGSGSLAPLRHRPGACPEVRPKSAHPPQPAACPHVPLLRFAGATSDVAQWLRSSVLSLSKTALLSGVMLVAAFRARHSCSTKSAHQQPPPVRAATARVRPLPKPQ